LFIRIKYRIFKQVVNIAIKITSNLKDILDKKKVESIIQNHFDMSVIYQTNLMILVLEYYFLYIGERKPIKFIAQTSSDLALTIKIYPSKLRKLSQ
jgi:hypothetical protein